MKDYIFERVMACAEHMLKTGCTVRGCANVFAVSKTTVHNDLRVRLPLIDSNKAAAVARVLKVNRIERHIRGGEATKAKYKRLEQTKAAD
ncbi:MAG: sporulation transcriptional regulator SpoIIID [Clostridia bacterium]|nr:sporulation transcriptional regulator SpoIIID [Clostridia bacterium]